MRKQPVVRYWYFDMSLEKNELPEVREYYRQIMELTPDANRMLSNLQTAEVLRQDYASLGFVKVNGVLPTSPFSDLLESMLPVLSAISEEVSREHHVQSGGVLSDAWRFRRIDPHCLRNPATRNMMSVLLEKIGLSSFSHSLATKLTPLVRYIAGPVRFTRSYFYLYLEEDYISVHDDHHVGDRVDVQFPVSIATIAGIRVLSGGFLKMFYDDIGSMNILGPRVWHDVPSIMRMNSSVDPKRFNMGFRFERE